MNEEHFKTRNKIGGNMTDEKTNENEQAQLRKIIAFQKVVLGIFLKWKWLFLLLFLLLGAVFMNYFRV